MQPVDEAGDKSDGEGRAPSPTDLSDDDGIMTDEEASVIKNLLDEFCEFWMSRIRDDTTDTSHVWGGVENAKKNRLDAVWSAFRAEYGGLHRDVMEAMSGPVLRYGDISWSEFFGHVGRDALWVIGGEVVRSVARARVGPALDDGADLPLGCPDGDSVLPPGIIWVGHSSSPYPVRSGGFVDSGWKTRLPPGRVGKLVLTYSRNVRVAGFRLPRIRVSFLVEVRAEAIENVRGPRDAHVAGWRVLHVRLPASCISSTCWKGEADPFVLTMWLTGMPMPARPDAPVELPISWASQGNDDCAGDFVLLVDPNTYHLSLGDACALSRKYFSTGPMVS